MKAHLMRRAFGGRRVLVGVCGGVAAYKVADLVSQLVQAGADVRVMMTPEATRFITPLTFEALTGQAVASDLFGAQARATPAGGEVHIGLSDWAEAILLVPATANVLAKLAHGLADEVVSTTVLASAAPLLLAPAMHARMWAQPATQESVAALRARGVRLVGPVEGRLASGEMGMGRLAEPEDILRALRDALPGERDLAAIRVLVTAGGTREPIDPVRFVGNRSSGLMGHSIAAAAEARGAQVLLVTAAPMEVPAGVEAVQVGTAAEMAGAIRERLAQTDILVMAAAVADFRPRERSDVKKPKAEMAKAIDLEANEDILASLAADPAASAVVRVGFAAETHDVLALAADKLTRKGLDLIVANDVSDPTVGMGSVDNAVTIMGRDGSSVSLSRAPKEEIADGILTAALQAWRSRGDAAAASAAS